MKVTPTVLAILAWVLIMAIMGIRDGIDNKFIFGVLAVYFIVRALSVLFSLPFIWRSSGNQPITLDRLDSVAGFDIISEITATVLWFAAMSVSFIAVVEFDAFAVDKFVALFLCSGLFVPVLSRPVAWFYRAESSQRALDWLAEKSRPVTDIPVLDVGRWPAVIGQSSRAVCDILTRIIRGLASVMPTSTKPEKRSGVAAFLDLQDSTHAWDQNATSMAAALRDFFETVNAAKGDKARFGNFTGDGFLLLYDEPMDCINSLADIIDAWEDVRRRYIEAYEITDEWFLALRTGVYFGSYLSLRLDRDHVVGSAINVAQRCESEGKKYFQKEDLFINILESERPKPHQRIFVCHNTVKGIKGALHSSKGLDALFKGITGPSRLGLVAEEEKQLIYAVWPKRFLPIGASPQTRGHSSEASRLPEDAELERLDRMGFHALNLADSAVGPAKLKLAESAVKYFRKALKISQGLGNPFQVAASFLCLGLSLRTQAELLSGPDQKKKFEEAVSAYHEALPVLTLEKKPKGYAASQMNLGLTFLRLSKVLPVRNKKDSIDAAGLAFNEALRVYTFSAAPGQFAATMVFLSHAIAAQARLLDDNDKKAQKLDDACAAYNEALRVYTVDADPGQYAFIQMCIGNVRMEQAQFLLDGAKASKLEEAVRDYREALRVTFETDSLKYAAAQAFLGRAFTHQANLLSDGARASKLEEAVQAYREALRGVPFKAEPMQYAEIQFNLGNCLGWQAAHLSSEEKKIKLNDVVWAYREALRVYNFDTTPDEYAMTQKFLGNALMEQSKFLTSDRAIKTKVFEAEAAFRESRRVKE